jgi:gluconokinase
MGVSGSGKSTVGVKLAEALGAEFVDGDDLHSHAARAKMTAGHALTDEDRWPWLDRIAARLAQGRTVVACSALRRVYRDRLRERAGAGLRFVYLKAEKETMRERVAHRPGHFMPASLIDSQFATLESPEGEAGVVTVAATLDVARQVAEAVERL